MDGLTIAATILAFIGFSSGVLLLAMAWDVFRN